MHWACFGNALLYVLGHSEIMECTGNWESFWECSGDTLECTKDTVGMAWNCLARPLRLNVFQSSFINIFIFEILFEFRFDTFFE